MKMMDVLLHSTQVRILTKVVSVLTTQKFGLKWFPPIFGYPLLFNSIVLLSLFYLFLEETPLAIAVQKKNNWLISKLRDAEVERFGSSRSANSSCFKRLLNCCSGLKVSHSRCASTVWHLGIDELVYH